MDSTKKLGAEYDAIRKDLLICHQGRAWQVIQYSITIQTAFIAGWYYVLFESKQHFLAIAASIFSLLVSHFLTQSLERYNDLMSQASTSLNKGTRIYLDSKTTTRHTARKTTEKIMAVIFYANIFMLGLSAGLWVLR
ncbi:hypothetical protein [Halomonas nitroreducens]|uniref:Uncharacterized protein n=1 Tax=Halomonas nitroreducens TaxID=447425 RepID=A0A3S0KPZ1_9GAMM|nr:hypothetical protein [Halomonas nitroreducens]RTR01928.1 hypothetical protein EKG36_13040 [Halomonas nitroreducens]